MDTRKFIASSVKLFQQLITDEFGLEANFNHKILSYRF